MTAPEMLQVLAEADWKDNIKVLHEEMKALEQFQVCRAAAEKSWQEVLDHRKQMVKEAAERKRAQAKAVANAEQARLKAIADEEKAHKKAELEEKKAAERAEKAHLVEEECVRKNMEKLRKKSAAAAEAAAKKMEQEAKKANKELVSRQHSRKRKQAEDDSTPTITPDENNSTSLPGGPPRPEMPGPSPPKRPRVMPTPIYRTARPVLVPVTNLQPPLTPTAPTHASTGPLDSGERQDLWNIDPALR